MAKAEPRDYVNITRNPRINKLAADEDIAKLLAEHVAAINELNARIYFLQEQIVILATAAGVPVSILEDY